MSTRTEDASFAVAHQLSPKLARSPEGFLVCLDVCVCRTAVKTPQWYSAEEVGEGGRGPVKVYRRPEAVFDKRFLASLQGKPIVSPHPPEFLTADNYGLYTKGIMIDPRVGPKLENGEGSVVCDLVIFDAALASQIEAGWLREVSCGYGCRYSRFKDGFQQENLSANHLAIVIKGRAGAEIRIHDAAGGHMPKATGEALIQHIQSIRDSVRTPEVDATPTGDSFRRSLIRGNEAYAAFAAEQEAAEDFTEQLKKAGQEMQRRHLPADLRQEVRGQCRDAALPVTPHAEPDAEDWAAKINAHGAAMRAKMRR